MRKNLFGAAVGFIVLAILALAVPASAQNANSGVKFTLEVDYTRSPADMIAVGQYQIVEIGVDKFLLNLSQQQGVGIKKMDVELIHIGVLTPHDLVLKEITGRGLRPATARELLAFGIAYPDEQRKHPIVALGTIVENQVLTLWVLGKDRRVVLDYVKANTAWRVGVRFLAVPIISK